MTIKEILENIYGITEEQGLSEDDIKYFENRFGKIPDTLKEFYLLCGNNLKVSSYNQDWWFLPEHYKKWEWLENSKDFLILNENQGVCHAFIRECDLGQANPPVYVSFDEDEQPKLCANSVDEFVKAFLIYEGSFGMPYFSEDFYFISEEDFDFIKNNFKEYKFKVANWMTDGVIRFFYDTPDSVIFVFVDNLQMHFSARNKETFDRLEELLGDMGE